jgi:hypothetical protein
MLKLDIAMFICDEQPLRRDYQDLITDDVLQPVRTALADPSRQTNVQNEVALVLGKLAVLRMMKAWPLLGRWATEHAFRSDSLQSPSTLLCAQRTPKRVAKAAMANRSTASACHRVR